MKKIIVFDLDGTLIDTSFGLNRCMNIALTDNGLDPIGLSLTKKFVGNGILNYVRRAVTFAGNVEKTADVYRDFMNVYSEHGAENCHLYDGMDEVLSKMKELGLKLAILTNKAQSATDLFNELYFKKYSFNAVSGQKPDLPLKPAPDGLERILDSLDVGKSDALMVGDGETDYLTAKNAGVDSLSVLWGFRSKAELISAGADHFAEKPSDIMSYILS